MIIDIETKYITKQEVVITKAYYQNGRTALILMGIEGRVATATVNLPDAYVPEGHVLIKNYSENEGILEALIKGGVVSEPIVNVPTGFVTVQLCKVLPGEECFP